MKSMKELMKKTVEDVKELKEIKGDSACIIIFHEEDVPQSIIDKRIEAMNK